ncbi:hypothetical protein M8C21_012626, partial [Ambrosia artemisiifolia]
VAQPNYISLFSPHNGERNQDRRDEYKCFVSKQQQQQQIYSAVNICVMAPPPGPYSGTSTLALVARVSAFSAGLVYGSLKLKYLKAKANSQRKAAAKAHH